MHAQPATAADNTTKLVLGSKTSQQRHDTTYNPSSVSSHIHTMILIPWEKPPITIRSLGIPLSTSLRINALTTWMYQHSCIQHHDMNTYWKSLKKACPFHLGFGQSNDPSRSSQTILVVVDEQSSPWNAYTLLHYIDECTWHTHALIDGDRDHGTIKSCVCMSEAMGYKCYLYHNTYALGKTHLTWGNMLDNSSARKDQPAPESPRPWNQKTVAVCLALAPTMTDVREEAILTESVESDSRCIWEPMRETTTTTRAKAIRYVVCTDMWNVVLREVFFVCVQAEQSYWRKFWHEGIDHLHPRDSHILSTFE